MRVSLHFSVSLYQIEKEKQGITVRHLGQMKENDHRSNVTQLISQLNDRKSSMQRNLRSWFKKINSVFLPFARCDET